MVERSQTIISRVMLVGVILALSLVMVGGILDLYYHGNTPVDYTRFHGIPANLLVFNSARGLIKLGLLVLILTQVMRVAIAGWFYMKLHDYFFTAISVFIVVVMLVTLIWQV